MREDTMILDAVRVKALARVCADFSAELVISHEMHEQGDGKFDLEQTLFESGKLGFRQNTEDPPDAGGAKREDVEAVLALAKELEGAMVCDSLSDAMALRGYDSGAEIVVRESPEGRALLRAGH